MLQLGPGTNIRIFELFEYLSADRHLNIAFNTIRIFVNNEYQYSCSNIRMDGEIRTASLFAIHSAEKKCKTKIRTTTKLQNYPPQNSLKLLLPIVKMVTI